MLTLIVIQGLSILMICAVLAVLHSRLVEMHKFLKLVAMDLHEHLEDVASHTWTNPDDEYNS